MARQGTTPIVTLTVDVERDKDGNIIPSSVLDYSNVYVTIDQNGTQITKASRDSADVLVTKHYNDEGVFDYTTVALYLSQSETLGFDVGKTRVQLRWVDIDGNAYASEIGTFNIEESLLQEVIEYGE